MHSPERGREGQKDMVCQKQKETKRRGRDSADQTELTMPMLKFNPQKHSKGPRMH